MTVYLLDVNVLIALLDAAHVQHDDAHDWFAKTGKKAFATCPLTENGLLRIVGHPKYPNSPGTPATVMRSLTGLQALPGHRFWAAHISLSDEQWVDSTHLTKHAQVTDTYLLALAKAHGGQLASMDRKLATDAVVDGAKALHLI
jgi:uncharacterized protein